MSRLRLRGRLTKQPASPDHQATAPPPPTQILPQRWVVIALAAGTVGSAVGAVTGLGDGALVTLGVATLLDQIME